MSQDANEGNVNKKDVLSRIVIKLRDSFSLRCHGPLEISDFFLHNDIIHWQNLAEVFPGIRINNLITSITPEEIAELINRARKTTPWYEPPNFLNYYSIGCPVGNNINLLLKLLLENKSVELAYIESEPAVAGAGTPTDNPLSVHQGHLYPAPIGIDARYAWAFRGGDGEGKIKFVDIEQGWILNHEDIVVDTIPGTGINCKAFQDHGAAVLGVILMQDNAVGGIGITPKANGYVVSQWRPDGEPNTVDAILTAIDYLDCGDIILLETQARDSRIARKLWPVEIQEAVFEAIRLATATGIIVIEAAGNGNSNSTMGNNLDLFVNEHGQDILNRSSEYFKDSGAILVAGSSNSKHGERIRYSNYGSRIDCNAAGEDVVTAGCFPGLSRSSIDTYTGKFSGTSSASAIIAGVAIATQSIAEANYHYRLMPEEMRKILSNELNGTPTRNGHGVDKIGVMPDLKKIIDGPLKAICNSNNDDKVEKTGFFDPLTAGAQTLLKH
jgi:hypothetical protein